MPPTPLTHLHPRPRSNGTPLTPSLNSPVPLISFANEMSGVIRDFRSTRHDNHHHRHSKRQSRHHPRSLSPSRSPSPLRSKKQSSNNTTNIHHHHQQHGHRQRRRILSPAPSPPHENRMRTSTQSKPSSFISKKDKPRSYHSNSNSKHNEPLPLPPPSPEMPILSNPSVRSVAHKIKDALLQIALSSKSSKNRRASQSSNTHLLNLLSELDSSFTIDLCELWPLIQAFEDLILIDYGSSSRSRSGSRSESKSSASPTSTPSYDLPVASVAHTLLSTIYALHHSHPSHTNSTTTTINSLKVKAREITNAAFYWSPNIPESCMDGAVGVLVEVLEGYFFNQTDDASDYEERDSTRSLDIDDLSYDAPPPPPEDVTDRFYNKGGREGFHPELSLLKEQGRDQSKEDVNLNSRPSPHDQNYSISVASLNRPKPRGITSIIETERHLNEQESDLLLSLNLVSSKGGELLDKLDDKSRKEKELDNYNYLEDDKDEEEREEMKKLEDDFSKSRGQVRFSDDEVYALEEEKGKLVMRVDALSRELEESRSIERENEMSKVREFRERKQLQTQVSELTRQISAKNGESDSLVSEVMEGEEARVSQVKELEDRVESMTRSLITERTEAEDLENEIIDCKVSWEIERHAWEEELESNEDKLININREVERLTSAASVESIEVIKGLESRIAELNKKDQNNSSKIDNLLCDISTLEDEKAILKNETVQFASKSSAQMEKREIAANERVALLKEENIKLEDKCNSIIESGKEYISKLEQSQVLAAEKLKVSRDTLVSELKVDLRKRRADFEHLESSKRILEREIETLKFEIIGQKRSESTFNEEAVEASRVLSNIRLELREAKDKARVTGNEILEANAQKQADNNTISRFESDASHLRSSLEKVKSKCDALIASSIEKDESIRDLESSRHNLASDKVHLSQNEASLRREIIETKAKADELALDKVTLTNRLDALSAKCEVAINEVKEIKALSIIKSDEVETLEGTILSLKNDNAKTASKLERVLQSETALIQKCDEYFILHATSEEVTSILTLENNMLTTKVEKAIASESALRRQVIDVKKDFDLKVGELSLLESVLEESEAATNESLQIQEVLKRQLKESRSPSKAMRSPTAANKEVAWLEREASLRREKESVSEDLQGCRFEFEALQALMNQQDVNGKLLAANLRGDINEIRDDLERTQLELNQSQVALQRASIRSPQSPSPRSSSMIVEAKLSDENAALLEEIEVLKEGRDRELNLRQSLDISRRELKELQSLKVQQEVASRELANKVDGLSLELADADGAKQKAVNDMDLLKGQLESLEARNTSIVDEQTTWHDAKSAIIEELTVCQAETLRLQSEVKELQTQKLQQTQRLTVQQQQLQQLRRMPSPIKSNESEEKENAALKLELSAIKLKLEDEEQKHQELVARLADQTQILEDNQRLQALLKLKLQSYEKQQSTNFSTPSHSHSHSHNNHSEARSAETPQPFAPLDTPASAEGARLLHQFKNQSARHIPFVSSLGTPLMPNSPSDSDYDQLNTPTALSSSLTHFGVSEQSRSYAHQISHLQSEADSIRGQANDAKATEAFAVREVQESRKVIEDQAEQIRLLDVLFKEKESEIRLLNDDMSSLEASLRRVKSEVADISGARDQLAADKEKLRVRLKDVMNEVGEVSDVRFEAERAKKEKSGLIKEIENAKEDFRDKEEEFEQLVDKSKEAKRQLKSQLDDLRSKLEESNFRLEASDVLLAESARKEQKSVIEIVSLKAEIAASEDSLKSSESDITAMRKEMRLNLSKLQKSEDELDWKNDQLVKDLNKDVVGLKSELTNAADLKFDLERETLHLKEKCANLIDAAAGSVEEKEILQSEFHDQLSTYKTKEQELRDDIDEMQRKHYESERMFKHRITELASQQADKYKIHKKQIASLEDDVSDLTNQLGDSAAEVKHLQEMVKSEESLELAPANLLDDELDEFRVQLDSANTEVKRLEEQIAFNEDAMNKKIHSHQLELAHSEREKNDSSSRVLEAEEELIEKKKELLTQKKMAATRVVDLESELIDLRADREREDSEEKAQLQAQVKKMQFAHQTLDEQKNQITLDAEDAISQLSDELESARSAAFMRNSDLKRSVERVRLLEEDLARLRKLEEDLDSKEGESEYLRHKLQKIEEDKESSFDSTIDVKRRYEQEHTEYENRLNELRQEMSLMSDIIVTLRVDKSSALADGEKLVSNLADLQKQLNDASEVMQLQKTRLFEHEEKKSLNDLAIISTESQSQIEWIQEVEKLKGKFDVINKEMLATMEKNGALQLEMAISREEVAASKSNTIGLNEKLASEARHVAELNTQLEGKIEAIAALKSRLQANEVEFQETETRAEVSDLKLIDLQNEHDTLNVQMIKSEERLEELQLAHSDEIKRCYNLAEELQSESVDNNELRDQLSSSSSNLASLTSRFAIAEKNSRNNESQMTELKEDNMRLEAVQLELRSEKKDERERQTASSKSLEDEITSLVDGKTKQVLEVGRLRGDVGVFEGKLTEALNSVDEGKVAIAKLTDSCGSLKVERDEFESLLDAEKINVHKLERLCETAERRNDDNIKEHANRADVYERKLLITEGIITKLRESIELLQNEIGSKTDEIDLLEKKMKEVDKLARSSSEAAVVSERALRDADDTAEMESSRADSLENDVVLLKVELEASLSEIERERIGRTKAEETAGGYEKVITDYEDRVKALESTEGVDKVFNSTKANSNDDDSEDDEQHDMTHERRIADKITRALLSGNFDSHDSFLQAVCDLKVKLDQINGVVTEDKEEGEGKGEDNENAYEVLTPFYKAQFENDKQYSKCVKSLTRAIERMVWKQEQRHLKSNILQLEGERDELITEKKRRESILAGTGAGGGAGGVLSINTSTSVFTRTLDERVDMIRDSPIFGDRGGKGGGVKGLLKGLVELDGIKGDTPRLLIREVIKSRKSEGGGGQVRRKLADNNDNDNDVGEIDGEFNNVDGGELEQEEEDFEISNLLDSEKNEIIETLRETCELLSNEKEELLSETLDLLELAKFECTAATEADAARVKGKCQLGVMLVVRYWEERRNREIVTIGGFVKRRLEVNQAFGIWMRRTFEVRRNVKDNGVLEQLKAAFGEARSGFEGDAKEIKENRKKEGEAAVVVAAAVAGKSDGGRQKGSIENPFARLSMD